MTEALAPCPFGRAVLAGQAGCALADLPFATIVPAMAAWQPRRRSGAGGEPAS
jgi:hypothetical protein